MVVIPVRLLSQRANSRGWILRVCARGGGGLNWPIVITGVGHFSKKWLCSLKCVVDVSIFTAVEDLPFTLYCLITE
jgi:hypothetical protein